MLASFRQRRRSDEGFTLIELMVVVLIIAILIAIAIPTFLGAQNRARDRAAQSNLRNGLTAIKVVASDDQGLFTNVDITSLHAAETAIDFQLASVAVDSDHVSIDIDLSVDPNTAELSDKSSSGTYYGMALDSNGVVAKCKGDAATDVDTYAHCTSTAAASGGSW